jgi:hypothetical protein
MLANRVVFSDDRMIVETVKSLDSRCVFHVDIAIYSRNGSAYEQLDSSLNNVTRGQGLGLCFLRGLD